MLRFGPGLWEWRRGELAVGPTRREAGRAAGGGGGGERRMVRGCTGVWRDSVISGRMGWASCGGMIGCRAVCSGGSALCVARGGESGALLEGFGALAGEFAARGGVFVLASNGGAALTGERGLKLRTSPGSSKACV